MKNARLVTRYRNGTLECEHRGSYVVVQEGKIVKFRGDSRRLTFFSSAAKPIQALAALEGGVAERLGLTPEEIALMAGSHNGNTAATQGVESILRKAELSVENLHCPAAMPRCAETRQKLLRAGLKATPLHHCCSGKHAGFLALARHTGTPLEDYDSPEHPVQQTVLELLAEFTRLAGNKMRTGTDGCGVPTYAVPLFHMAQAFALLTTPGMLEPTRRGACRRLLAAAHAHPDLLSGEGEFTTELTRATGERLLVKPGGGGVFALGVVGANLGLAIKFDDGRYSPIPPLACALLKELGHLESEEEEALFSFLDPTMTNERGQWVGEIKLHL